MIYEIKTIEEFLTESNKIEEVNSFKADLESMMAWTYLITQNELSYQTIIETHRILMEGLRPDIAGCLRNINVRVGLWHAPNPGQVRRMLIQWIDKPKTEKEIKKAHIAFEKIHPFEDGNGRVGRILMNWQRVKNNLPLLIIHTGKGQREYYKWFN